MAIIKKNDRYNLFICTFFAHNVIVANNCLLTERSSHSRIKIYRGGAIQSTFKDENEAKISLKSQPVPRNKHTPSQ